MECEYKIVTCAELMPIAEEEKDCLLTIDANLIKKEVEFECKKDSKVKILPATSLEEGARIERERIIEQIDYLICHTYKCRYEANELPDDEYIDGLLVGRLEILEILKDKIEDGI